MEDSLKKKKVWVTGSREEKNKRRVFVTAPFSTVCLEF